MQNYETPNLWTEPSWYEDLEDVKYSPKQK